MLLTRNKDENACHYKIRIVSHIYANVCCYFARHGYLGVNVEYRRAPRFLRLARHNHISIMAPRQSASRPAFGAPLIY